jgi:hypothetical protein
MEPPEWAFAAVILFRSHHPDVPTPTCPRHPDVPTNKAERRVGTWTGHALRP